MQIKAILFAPLVAAGFASAAPSKQYNFEAIALRSASPIHFAGVQASQNGIFLNLAKQKATCDRKSDNLATFSLVDGQLSLYRKSATPQTLFVDRSGMGQGVLGYTTGAQSTPRNGERKGWKVDKYGDLSFNGSGFIACPNEKGSWSVWVSAGVDQPGGNKGCLPFVVRTVKTDKPNSCLYTEYKP